MSKPYLNLYLGALVQESAATVGGNRPHELVDHPFCQDGQNRPTLRGTAIAGALFATMRAYAPELPDCFTGGQRPSALRIHTSHPARDATARFRQQVAIRHATGAAADKALRDREVLPRHTEWPLLIELATHERAKVNDEHIALLLAALDEWRAGRCFLGGDSARGLGWMRLDGLHGYALTAEQALMWPCASPSGRDENGQPLFPRPEEYLASQPELARTRLNDEELAKIRRPPRRRPVLDLTGYCRVGPREDVYGLDTLSVGGHVQELEASLDATRFLAPEGMARVAWEAGFRPDRALALETADGAHEPVIPGSALRGPLRHTLSRHLRAGGGVIDDPVIAVRRRLTGEDEAEPESVAPASDAAMMMATGADVVTTAAAMGCPERERGRLPALSADAIEDLFGTLNKAGYLRIRDAHAEPGWRGAWLQQHAEDEYAAGVFDNSKFDRLAIIEGSFRWRMVLEAPADRFEALRLLLESALTEVGASRQLPVGGGQWRGHGWVEWGIEKRVFVPAEVEDPIVPDESKRNLAPTDVESS